MSLLFNFMSGTKWDWSKMLSLIPIFFGFVFAQNESNSCGQGFYPGTDEVFQNLPYTYTQVVGIIGDFKNISYMGVNPDNVTLTGPDNKVGTTRSYTLLGAPIEETIISYSKPPTSGPYIEDHTVHQVFVGAFNVTASASHDKTVAASICDGKGTSLNLTTVFCATNATTAAAVFHSIHMGAVQTVGQDLGGANFTNCQALEGS